VAKFLCRQSSALARPFGSSCALGHYPPEGSLLVRWAVEDKNVELIWVERDGPPVALPTKSGFGTRLIQLNVEQQLQGKLDAIWEERGLSR
jgi:two-component sensor histidine kinase